MDVTIDNQKDKLNCDTYDKNMFEGDSFHVIDYMTLFEVSVNLRYQITDNESCDIVDDDLQVCLCVPIYFFDFESL